MGVRSLHCYNHVYTFLLLCLSYVRHAVVAVIAGVTNQLVVSASIMLSDGNALCKFLEI
jgi:hypothetical protein